MSSFPFLHESMYSYNKTQHFSYDPKKLAFNSISRPEVDLISCCVHNFKKTVSFDDMVHFVEEENIVNYVFFDCGATFYPQAFCKSWRDQPRTEKIFQILCKTQVKPKERSP